MPFSELPSDAKASTRHEYITLDRLIKYGPSPFCAGCEKVTGRHTHTPACRARFDALIKADKIRAPKTPSKVVSSPLTPSVEIEKDTGKPLGGDDVHAPSDTEESTGLQEDLPFSAGIPPGHPEHREHAAAARINTEIDQEFIMKNEQGRKFWRMHKLTGSDTIFEYACSENSILGEMCESVGVEGIRLSGETIDLADGVDGWVTLLCTDFCLW